MPKFYLRVFAEQVGWPASSFYQHHFTRKGLSIENKKVLLLYSRANHVSFLFLVVCILDSGGMRCQFFEAS